MANISLNTKTYTGNGIQNGIATYVERSGGVASSFSPLTGSVRLGSGETPSRIAWKLVYPVVATDDSECGCAGTVLRSSTIDISVRVSPTATSAELTDLSIRLKDLAADATFMASIASLASPTG